MARHKTLALIMAGGAGGRMGVLTDSRAKPALPFGGVYHLIDIPLSNCMHSGISDVWVVEQFQPQSLNDHLANGRPWDLDRTYGGLRILPPYTGNNEGGWHRGNADAIYRQRRFIESFDPELLLVLSADHVYQLDFDAVIEAHLARQAEVTLVTTTVPPGESASRFGNLQAGSDGRVREFAYKPEQPISDTITTEIFVYTPRVLLDVIGELAAQQGDDESETALSDFGDELLPLLVERGRAFAFPLDGYWRDVGTIPAYWQAHMDLLADPAPITLDAPEWPLRSYGQQRLPARIRGSARIADSLIASGCTIGGAVEHSVLASGVCVAAGATVRDAVLLEDVVVEAGAVVERAIVDRGVHVGRDKQVRGRADGGEQDIAVAG